eukprot:scaffold2771_cov252-Pinguiococcus_pyrenoidosus.AAC.29
MMGVIHRDPGAGKERQSPTEFKPERFQKRGSASIRNGFLPFAYGARTCIGKVSWAAQACTVEWLSAVSNPLAMRRVLQ